MQVQMQLVPMAMARWHSLELLHFNLRMLPPKLPAACALKSLQAH